MMNHNFTVFILSHGRPDNVLTYKTLLDGGYTGKIYIIVDNEDKTANQYIETFGADNVIVFDKKAMADKIDEGNNFDNRKVIVHARNFCFEAAKSLGIEYFLQLDDDYTSFRYRYIDKYITKGKVQNFDKLFNSMLKFYEQSDFHSIAFAQGGDFIGGASCGLLSNYLYNSRKCMNSFFCSTKRPFQFVGSINEDVNTYTSLASKGLKFMTIPFVGLEQLQTQSQGGGMTDAYLTQGTYVKSFTSVLMQPSSVICAKMGFTSRRIHHRVAWKTTVPLIVKEKYKKQNLTRETV
jgi:hypothetical protein